jgi:predicted P-loop ATPase
MTDKKRQFWSDRVMRQAKKEEVAEMVRESDRAWAKAVQDYETIIARRLEMVREMQLWADKYGPIPDDFDMANERKDR